MPQPWRDRTKSTASRNFNAILRVLDSLQLTDHYKVATLVDWQDSDDVVVVRDDVVVVPSISTEDARQKFQKGVTEIKPYLRLTPQPNR